MIVIAGRGMDKIKADAQEKGDLGLVAEFSELEGPREVVCILLSLHSLVWRNVASSF